MEFDLIFVRSEIKFYISSFLWNPKIYHSDQLILISYFYLRLHLSDGHLPSDFRGNLSVLYFILQFFVSYLSINSQYTRNIRPYLLRFALLTKYNLLDQIKKFEMGRTSSRYGEEKKCI
jgi:hypothetical protein